MDTELTQEEVFSNDVDPLDAIRELRKAEGVPEDQIIEPEDSGTAEASTEESESADDLDAFTAEDADDESTEEAEAEAETKTEDPGEAPNTEEPATEPEGEAEAAEEEEEEATTVAEKRKFKANGQDFEFSEEEILEKFEGVFGQAMNYTQKLQAIAPYRKMISALEDEGITQDQLNLALDALKGDKGALNKMLESNDIKPYDLGSDDTDPYVSTDYGKTDAQIELSEVATAISKDPEYSITRDVVDTQWDDQSRTSLRENPRMLSGLHNDIKTGLYDKVAPVAAEMQMLDGNSKSAIEYYMLAGQQVSQQEESNKSRNTVDELNKQTQDEVANADKASSEAARKRAATSTRTRAGGKKVIDYLDDNDADFDDWYAKLEASS